MPKIISIINMKGGVGKTTLTVHLGFILSHFHNKKVLIIDVDPQFNASQYLIDQDELLSHFEKKKTIYDILVPREEEEISLSSRKRAKKKSPKLNDYIHNAFHFASGKLDIVPSSLKLINFDTQRRGTEFLLERFVEDFCQDYDIILIDCPPTLSTLTLSAFLASQYYLIPTKPDFLSTLGLPLLERGLKEYEKTFRHKLKPIGIVFTLVNNNTNVTSAVMAQVKSKGRHCFTAKCSSSTKVAQTVLGNTASIEQFYRKAAFARYAKEFKEIAAEFLNSIK